MQKGPGTQQRACSTDVVARGRVSSGYQAHRETHTKIHKRESESSNSALSHAAQLAPGVLPQRGQSTCLETCDDTHLWPPGAPEGVGGRGEHTFLSLPCSYSAPPATAAAGPKETTGRPSRGCGRSQPEQEASVLAAWETASSLKSSKPSLHTRVR